MNLKLSENLRILRLARGMTQEQMAEFLNLSPQAVSRWENGSASPDITVLVSMANLFEVSLDELVGRDFVRQSMKLNDVFTESGRCRADGRDRDALALLTEALPVYPNNCGIKSEIALTAARLDDASEEEIEYALRLSDDVEKSAESRKLIATTCANHVILLMRAGRREQARQYAGTLAHLWESRELMLPETADDGEYTEQLRLAIRKTLTVLCGKIRFASMHRAGMPDEMLAQGADYDAARPVREQIAEILAFLN